MTSGYIDAFKITTSEYNEAMRNKYQNIYVAGDVTQVNLLPSLGILMSVSECPGDFTSPALLSHGYGGERPGNSCMTFQETAHVESYGRLNIAIRNYAANESHCLLDENKTYYLNITMGFEYRDESTKPSGIPFIGHTYGPDANGTPGLGPKIFYGYVPTIIKTTGGSLQDVITSSSDTTEVVKNKSALYAEIRRIKKIQEDEQRRRTDACPAAIAAAGRRCN